MGRGGETTHLLISPHALLKALLVVTNASWLLRFSRGFMVETIASCFERSSKALFVCFNASLPSNASLNLLRLVRKELFDAYQPWRIALSWKENISTEGDIFCGCLFLAWGGSWRLVMLAFSPTRITNEARQCTCAMDHDEYIDIAICVLRPQANFGPLHS